MPPVLSSRRVLPAGFAAVEIKLTGPASTHPPSFGFAVDTDVTADIGTALGNWLGVGADHFLDRLYPDYAVDRIICRTSTETVEVPINQPGTGVGADLMTPAVACLVKCLTSTPGRRGTGRMYWPGVLNDTDVDNAGVIDPATISSLQDVADKLGTDLLAEGITQVLLHSYSWPYGDPDPGVPVGFPAPSPVTGLAVQAIVATQRRRQR